MDDEEPPPPELSLAWMCGEHHLPDAGGVLDQEYQRYHRMQIARNIYNALSHMRNCQGAQIHSLNMAERRTIQWLLELGLI